MAPIDDIDKWLEERFHPTKQYIAAMKNKDFYQYYLNGEAIALIPCLKADENDSSIYPQNYDSIGRYIKSEGYSYDILNKNDLACVNDDDTAEGLNQVYVLHSGDDENLFRFVNHIVGREKLKHFLFIGSIVYATDTDYYGYLEKYLKEPEYLEEPEVLDLELDDCIDDLNLGEYDSFERHGRYHTYDSNIHYTDRKTRYIISECMEDRANLMEYQDLRPSYNRIAIYLNMAPSTGTIFMLKAHGWRWHTSKEYWFKYYSPKNEDFAIAICSGQFSGINTLDSSIVDKYIAPLPVDRISIDELALYPSLKRLLKNAGNQTLGDLRKMNVDDFLDIYKFGRASLKKIIKEMAKYDVVPLGFSVNSLSLYDTELAESTRNLLKSKSLEYLGQLCNITENDLVNKYGFRKAAIYDIFSEISCFGITPLFNPPRKSNPYEEKSQSMSPNNILLEDMDLSSRCYKALKRAGKTSLNELSKMTVDEIMSIKGFSKTKLQEILTAMNGYGTTPLNFDIRQLALIDIELSDEILYRLGKAQILHVGDIMDMTFTDIMTVLNQNRSQTLDIVEKLSEYNVGPTGYSNEVNPENYLLTKLPELDDINVVSKIVVSKIEPWNDKLLSETKLSGRPYNCLKKAGIETIGDLCKMTSDELLNLPWFGLKCLEIVRYMLSKYGRSLADEE